MKISAFFENGDAGREKAVRQTAWIREKYPSDTLVMISAGDFRQMAQGQKQFRTLQAVLIFAAFAVFTALTGTGLSYARLNFQEVLTGNSPASPRRTAYNWFFIK